MKEFKGTKGPWEVNVIGPHWNNDSLTHLEVTFGRDGECVCDTVYQLEDANLIAAAPELLEAVMGLLESHGEIGSANVWSINDSPEGLKARAAITKALGEPK